MAVGQFTSDLAPGDVLGPVDYTMSRFVVREYCHSNELHHAIYQGVEGQIAPPTLVHLDKLRLYRHSCPKGTGPSARVHIEYDANIHAPVPVGVPLRVQGRVAERYLKRGRDYVEIVIELRTRDEGKLLIEYHDTVIVSYKSTDEPPKEAKR